jgi:hypothetical protein
MTIINNIHIHTQTYNLCIWSSSYKFPLTSFSPPLYNPPYPLPYQTTHSPRVTDSQTLRQTINDRSLDNLYTPKKVIHYRYDTLFDVSEFIQDIYSRAIFLFNYRIIRYIYVSKHHALKYPYHILDREPCHIIRNSHITIK